MFFRLSLSLILIGTGIASPWLVRDWLKTQPSERSLRTVVDSALDYPRQWSKWVLPDPKEDAEEVVVDSPGREAAPEPGPESADVEATGLSRRPYPLASTSARVLRGFLPGKAGGSHGLAGFGSSSSAPTSFSKGVVQETGSALEKELGRLGLELGSPIFVRIFKEEKELEVWMEVPDASHYILFKVYRVRDSSGDLGPKLREGDGQIPEGFYHVGNSRLRPSMKDHLGMDLGFPNDLDRALGRSGESILIHGGVRSSGSVALAPEHMNELYTLAHEALHDGQRFFRVHVFPFRMTDDRMEREWARQPKWIDFWANLKEGYDFFENANFPPRVEMGTEEYGFRLP